MKVLLSPTKTMKDDVFDVYPATRPACLDKTEYLLEYLKGLELEELQKILACSEKIAKENEERFLHMDLHETGHNALMSYDGIQYRYMHLEEMDEQDYMYLNEHIRILSGFYGLLKPSDGIFPYRLEMKSKIQLEGYKSLYAYWQDDLYQLIEDHVILNLASKEYDKVIRKYIKKSDTFVDCIFGEMIDGRVREKGAYVKMARGEMVSFIVKNKILNIEEIQTFDSLGFHYEPALSTKTKYVFIR